MDAKEWAEFFKALWPNLTATVLGIIIGIPLALWLNRRILLLAEHRNEESEQKQLVTSLQVITQALKDNQERLSTIIEKVDGGSIPFDTGLNTTAWEAVRSIVIRSLHDPRLQGSIAYHFSQLAALAKLYEYYVSLYGSINARMPNIHETREPVRKRIIEKSKELTDEARRTIEEIEKNYQSLSL